MQISKYCIRRRGVVGRIPAFQPGGSGSIPGRVRYFNCYPGIGCASFVFKMFHAHWVLKQNVLG